MSVVSLTDSQWASRIQRKMAATVENIIDVGVDLELAKQQLGHGRFGRMLTTCQMDERTAQRFMQIARHEVLANPTTWSHLPASYRSLSELARWEPVMLERAIERGEVTPETTTQTAGEMYKRYHDVPDPKAKPPKQPPPADENGESTDDPTDGGPITSGSEPREGQEVPDDAGTSGSTGACPTCGGTGTVAA